MQRYSDGLKVPKLMMDVFTGKTTGTGADVGKIWCELTYTPKSVDHILVPPMFCASGQAFATGFVLSGKTLRMTIFRNEYDKVDTPTGGANSGGVGADPHTHGLSYTSTGTIPVLVDTEGMDPIQVHYTVA